MLIGFTPHWPPLMCSCSHAISAKEKSSTSTQQMARNRKCSLVIPKTQYFNSTFPNCCVSWIWSQAFRPFLQATKFDMAHLVLVAVFLGAKSTKSCFCCIVYILLLTFLVLWHTKLQLFFNGFHLGTSLSVELFLLELVHSPKQNCSWHFLERFWIFAKSEGEIKSMTHYSRRAT